MILQKWNGNSVGPAVTVENTWIKTWTSDLAELNCIVWVCLKCSIHVTLQFHRDPIETPTTARL